MSLKYEPASEPLLISMNPTLRQARLRHSGLSGGGREEGGVRPLPREYYTGTSLIRNNAPL